MIAWRTPYHVTILIIFHECFSLDNFSVAWDHNNLLDVLILNLLRIYVTS